MGSGAAGPLEPHLAKARPVSVREKPAAPATVIADVQPGHITMSNRGKTSCVCQWSG